ncbi:MAG: hypothetical protein RIT27_1648 [Pseudomonadota bacterium]|jgi:hypothetical protein
MKILKLMAIAGSAMAIGGCVIVPPDNGEVFSPQPSIGPGYYSSPPEQVYIVTPPPPHRHLCHDRVSGEYLDVRPDSKRCREWLYENQREREHHKHRPHPRPPSQPILQPEPIKPRPPAQPISPPVCIDSSTGKPVQGVAANSPQCAKINNNPPPLKQSPPPQAAPCIDKNTGKPVQGVSANTLQCAKINH